MPSASSGTRTPAAAALFAASGPATPSIAPCPNSSGCLVSRRSTLYERTVGISAPPAGSAPSGKPSADPRSHGFQDRDQSARPSHGRPAGTTVPVVCRSRLATQIASPKANSPTATTTTSTPSSSCGTPKVIRACPVWVSMPTRPMARPRPRLARPRTTDRPSTAATVVNATAMRAT